MKFNYLLLLPALTLMLTSLAFGQSEQTVVLKLEKVKKATNQSGDQEQSIDLLAEVKRQNPGMIKTGTSELSRVEVQVKSGLGGAGVYLVVNGQPVDSLSVETNPDLFGQSGGEAKVQLKNPERSVDSALLRVVGQAALEAVSVVFSPIEDFVILGSYVNKDITIVGGAGAGAGAKDDQIFMIRPPLDVIRPNGGIDSSTLAREASPDKSRNQDQGTDAQANAEAPFTPQAQIRPVPKTLEPKLALSPQQIWIQNNCLQNHCVGDTVSYGLLKKGRILRVLTQEGVLEIQLNSGGAVVRTGLRQVRWISRD